MAIPKPITVQLTEKDINRFWSYVNLSADRNACWEWTGNRQRGKNLPYGQIKIQGKMYVASRIAFVLCYRKDPWPLHVGHHCDNPPCCRPDHLFATTPKGNSEDMVRKGRSTIGDRNGQRKHPERTAKGERQHLAKLTEADVVKMRELYMSGHYSSRRLGRMFHMDKSSILDVVTGHTWKHVPFPVNSAPNIHLLVGSHQRRASRYIKT